MSENTAIDMALKKWVGEAFESLRYCHPVASELSEDKLNVPHIYPSFDRCYSMTK